MTSGMSAKGSTLGTDVPEGGVASSRAPLPRAPGNGTKRSRESSSGTNFQEAGITDTPETSHPALSSSVRTLILGIDYDGRIVQHDRNAALILARKPEDLLGAQLIDLTSGPHGNHVKEDEAQGNSHTARPGDAAAAVAGLLEAIRSDREGSAMLTIDTRDGPPAEAVVTVHPMRAGGTSLAALALLRIPAPNSERFVDPALMRRQMLDDALTRIGDTLDIDDVARVLLDAIVPHFCNVAGLLLLESLAGDDELPSHGPEGSLPLRRIALLHDGKDPAWEATFPTGEILRYPKNTPYYRCMDTGAPVLEATISKSQAGEIAKSWRRKPVAKLLSGASMVVLPLIARGTMLGFFVCTRQEGFRRFDAYDVEIGMDFATRAAVFIDNARRYSREHATALTLQRSMLPTGLSFPSSVEVRHRYLPGSKMIEVGGDWYESIALPGGRVALVVGDVAGHGVRAAVTMGRLRTAIHTLAMLELPPADSLLQLDELMHTLGEREPHFATCAYAVYDAVSGYARWRWPATCRRCSCTRTAATSCWTCRPRRRSASATARWRAASSRWRTAACSCCTPTAWWRTRARTSVTGWPGCAASSAPARRRGRSRTCARPRWTGCTPITSATTSRCSSRGCGGCPRTATPHGRSRRS